MRVFLFSFCALVSSATFAQSSMVAKKEIVSAVKNASESLTADDCSVFAKLTGEELTITMEKFGPAEALVLKSKAQDEVFVSKAGTSANPRTRYTFLKNNTKSAVFEVEGYEDLSNTRFNLYSADGRLLRTCLYQE